MYLRLAAVSVSVSAARDMQAQPVIASGRPVVTVLQHTWVPASPIGTDSLRVEQVSQQAVPLTLRLGGTGVAGLDLSAAYARSTVVVRRRSGATESLQLDGPTDVRALLSFAAFGEHAAVLVGGTIPVGLAKLTQNQLTALGAIGAPAVSAPVAAFGSGGTGSLGVTSSVQWREWTFTGGGSYEYRFRYAPIGQLVPSAPVDATLAPGPTLSLSVRARGAIAGTAVVTDFSVRQFRADTFSLVARARTSRVVYRLGALTNMAVRLSPSVLRARDVTLTLARTARAPYEVLGLGPVAASNAQLQSVAATMTLVRLGRVRAAGGLEARGYSGIQSDSSLVAAKFSDQTASVSIAVPVRLSEFVFSAAVSRGSLMLRERSAVGMQRLVLKGQINAL
jgi:hypothetical protein